MPAADAPLIIVDNSLIDERGHHLALARTMARAALSEGRRVMVYAHRTLDPSLLPEGTELHRVFTLSVYELFAQKLLNHDMGIEMREVLSRVARENPDGGRILFHTADAYTYCAIADWLAADAPQSGAWSVHVVTPYEPKLMPGFALKGGALNRALCDLAAFRNPRIALYFWVETARLAEFYRRGYGLCAAVLELPAPQWATDPAQAQPLREGRLVMLFLGAAREEKGFLHIPDLAAEIARRPGLAERVVLRLQRSAPIAGMPPKIGEAFEKLRGLPFVEIVEGALELDAYAAEMRAADMALLLYSATNYFARGSGIVMETLSAGKRALGMRGTFMERLDHAGMIHFGAEAGEWTDHVAALAADLDAARAAAADAGARFARRFSASRYIEALDRRERFARHIPSVHALGLRHRLPILVAPPGRV